MAWLALRTLAGAELLLGFPPLLLQLGQAALHLLSLALQTVSLVCVAPQVGLRPVLPQLGLYGSGVGCGDTLEAESPSSHVIIA